MAFNKQSTGIDRNRTWAQKLIVVFPILCLVIYQSAFNQLGSILASVQTAFPDAPQTLVQMVLTTPSLVSIPMSLLSGVFATFWPRKKICIGALILMIVGGLLPTVLHSSIYFLFISSAFIGLAQGLIISTSTALIAESFADNDRDLFLGWKVFAGNIGSTFIALAVGFLAVSAWYNAYFVYALTVVILILVIIFLPMGKPDQKLVSKTTGAEGLKFIANPHYIYMVIVCLFCGMFLFVFYTNASMAVQQNGGDVTVSSAVFALNTVFALITGVVFGFIVRLLKKFSMTFAFIVIGVAFLIIGTSTDLIGVSIGSACFGFGATCMQASTLAFTTDTLPQKSQGIGIAIAMAATSFGITLSPIIVNSVRNAIFGNELATAAMIVACGGWFILAIIELLREIFFVKHTTIGVSTKKVAETLEAEPADAAIE